jgi:hypothetical protein
VVFWLSFLVVVVIRLVLGFCCHGHGHAQSKSFPKCCPGTRLHSHMGNRAVQGHCRRFMDHGSQGMKNLLSIEEYPRSHLKFHLDDAISVYSISTVYVGTKFGRRCCGNVLLLQRRVDLSTSRHAHSRQSNEVHHHHHHHHQQQQPSPNSLTPRR